MAKHVRLTGKYLRSTGQQRGQEGTKRFELQECTCELCASGSFVATTEPSYDGECFRHLAKGNIEACK